MIKPFRLISSSEMAQFKAHFAQVLDDWNAEYAMTPLALSITAPPHDYIAHDGLTIFNENNHLAIVEEHYLSVFNQTLFSENHSCFNAISQKLMLMLVSRLLKIEECSITETIQSSPSWFYKGSTCLFLTLHAHHNNVTFILNPAWVYQHLSPYQKATHDLCFLDDALAEEALKVEVTLLPFNLPIEHLLTIQVGDVLVTDHPTSTPLQVIHQGELLTQADLGQSSQQKSILLKRSL
ncbi:FliM/FliN family flagellar motor C-terminal domain-containing protein [Legionella fallonii]|uniref:Flagellar motor switch protein FliN-like C-terminal domain-containing protein n=1 Tax=Legionella fallonii LLAP-10 TaxID=1212491 RepID=A0A098G4R0_9GAMM|nr:FliM/FliN family flagellar motor C-terminal domain-containing protein [Legionella fallonii]CEG57452.1 conserved protein of unknown function [Legionella fallonii LLAP-10]